MIQVLKLIGQFIQVGMFLLNLWKEKDEAKAEIKKKLATKVIDAFKQTDKKERATRLNLAINDIRRL